MQRFWGRWAKWALPLAWGAAFAVPVSATAEDGAEAELRAALLALEPQAGPSGVVKHE